MNSESEPVILVEYAEKLKLTHTTYSSALAKSMRIAKKLI